MTDCLNCGKCKACRDMINAKNEVIAKYEKLCHWCVVSHSYCRYLGINEKHHDYDDALNVARMAVFKAHKRFDPARGTKFVTFATQVAIRSITNYMRVYSRRGFIGVADHHHMANVHTFDDVGPLMDMRPVDESIDHRDELATVLNFVDTNTTRKERKAFYARCKGATFEKVGRKIGVKKVAAAKIIARLHSKIREHFQEECHD